MLFLTGIIDTFRFLIVLLQIITFKCTRNFKNIKLIVHFAIATFTYLYQKQIIEILKLVSSFNQRRYNGGGCDLKLNFFYLHIYLGKIQTTSIHSIHRYVHHVVVVTNFDE